MKKFLALFLLFALVMALAACGGGTTQPASQTPSSSSQKEESAAPSPSEESATPSPSKESDESSTEETKSSQLSIEDIAWSVDEGIIDGDRYVLMSYTNNSPFVIAGLELSFTEKSTVTDEDRETYYSEIQEAFEFTDEDMEELKEIEIAMHTETDRVVAVGETASNIYCYYNSGYYYLKNLDHYDLVEPDIAKVRYVDDGKIYTEYYDFKSGKYTMDGKAVAAYKWSTSSLGDRIPKPDVVVVDTSRDDEETFWFDAYGMSLEQFDAYVEECKALGYTVDVRSYEGFYTADNDEKYNVYLNYDENDNSMSGTVEAPEEEDAEDTAPSEVSEDTDSDEQPEESDSSAELVDGMRAEFKEAMDAYEAFMDEYCDFMTEYQDNPTDLELLAQYADMLAQEAEMNEKFAAWDQDEMNAAELKYYLEVSNRVMQKLLDVSEN